MKEIIYYESEDSVVFNNKKDCEDYEVFLMKCKDIEKDLGEWSPDLVLNPVQKDMTIVKDLWEKFKKLAYDFANRFHPDYKNSDILLIRTRPDIFPGEMFREENSSCIYHLWNRFNSIDWDTGIMYFVHSLIGLKIKGD